VGGLVSTPEEPTAEARPPKAKASRRFWIIGIGVALAAGAAWYLWKQHQANAAAAAPAADTTGTASTDANAVDYAGQLSVIQTELEALLAEDGASGAAGGTTTATGTVTVPKVTGMTATAAKTALAAVGLKAGSEGSNGGSMIVNSQTPGAGAKVAAGSTVDLGVVQSGATGGKPGGGGGTQPKPGPVPGVHAVKVTATSVGLAWGKVGDANSYEVRTTYQGKVVKHATTRGTSATVSGLTPVHTYGFHVAAVNSAGTGPEGDVQVKTK
jgi:hypothetical protein